MKKGLARVISLLLVILLAVGCLAPLTSCKKPDEGTPDNSGNSTQTPGGNDNPGGSNTETPTTADYDVVVTSRYGLPLKNVWAVIYEGDNTTQTVDQARTDATGKASFKLDKSKSYTIKLEGVPDGYIVGENKFTFDAARKASIQLTSAPISDGDIRDVDMYQVGDVIHDFFITDTNGEEYLISSVLEEKNLLVLNFWYTGCGPCVSEIPYMIQAYENYNGIYGDVVEIFGINDYGESNATINNFKVEVVDPEGNTTIRGINFPTFNAVDPANGFAKSEMVMKFYRTVDAATGQEGYAYPISVFIDRAGVICCIEAGGLPSETVWTNTFNHFNAADYKQKLVESIADFNPIEKPNVTPPSFEEIDEVLTGNYRDSGEKIQVTYRWEENEYSWPFVIEGIGNTVAVRPSNVNKDNSYAILYADVYLEAGDALIFDYLSSTQNNSNGVDYLVTIVDGKDIYTIRGLDTIPAEGEEGVWNTCCTFVAKESKVYEVAFTYLKDYSGYMGKDGVFLRNLRVVDESEVESESYIFRYAATEPSEYGEGFNKYVNLVEGADGYLHVGSANGPILLAQLVDTYTQFDGKSTVFERLYNNTNADGEPEFLVNGVNVFATMEAYGNYAANSKLPGVCPVTPELASFLDAYAYQYATKVGKLYSENLWLSLCCYYDAYGTDGKQLEDPIRGLAPFSAPKLELDTVIDVTYDTILIPRGYLYAFTPAADGVYRITTYGSATKLAWIFTSTSNGGAGQRVLVADSENSSERISPELIFSGYKVVCPNCYKDVIYPKQYDGEVEVDPVGLTCDDPFCVDDSGNVTPITDFSQKVEVISIDHDNVSMIHALKGGVTYYIAVAFHDPNELGTLQFKMTYVGENYSQFTPVSPGSFTFDLTANGGMGATIAGGKKVRLCDIDGCHDCAEMAEKLGKPEGTKYYHVVENGGRLGSLVFVDFHLSTSIFPSNSLKDVINSGMFDFSHYAAKTDLDIEAENILKEARKAGMDALFDEWLIENPALTEDDLSTRWLDYDMTAVMDGDFSSLEKLENAAEYIAQATEWKAFVEAAEDEWLHDYFGAEYDEKWAYYQMDDVKAGIWHGEAKDYTADMQAYVALLLDEADHPERQGCIAVDEELAKMLQLLMDRETFEGVENSWVKLAYYYAEL